MLTLYKVSSIKFTTQNDLYQSYSGKHAVILNEIKFENYNYLHMKSPEKSSIVTFGQRKLPNKWTVQVTADHSCCQLCCVRRNQLVLFRLEGRPPSRASPQLRSTNPLPVLVV